jgi:hypothetical protein
MEYTSSWIVVMDYYMEDIETCIVLIPPEWQLGPP